MKTFWIVGYFDGGAEDFVIDGIYTLQSDAELHKQRLVDEKVKGAFAGLHSYDGIVNMLIENRMKPFAAVIKALNYKISGVFDVNGFPMAVVPEKENG